MAVEWREHHERVQAATDRMSKGVAALHESLCPADARPLDPHGQCHACGRVFRLSSNVAPAKKPEMTPKEQAAWWARYDRRPQTKPTTLTDEEAAQAQLQAEFWDRHDRRRAEREAKAAERGQERKKPTPTTLVEQAADLVRTGRG